MLYAHMLFNVRVCECVLVRVSVGVCTGLKLSRLAVLRQRERERESTLVFWQFRSKNGIMKIL